MMFLVSCNACINLCRNYVESERVSNIKSFINKYNQKGIDYSSKIDVQKTFEKNNPTTALNNLYIKEKDICPVYISKINSNCVKQIILLIIPNKERWNYFAVKQLPTFLRGITAKHHGDFYCLNCLHSFRIENEIQSHEKVSNNKDFC